MAAAEYYGSSGNGGMPPASASQQHLRPPGLVQGQSTLPYPISDAPPPYSAIEQSRPQSQPPPQRPYSPHVNFAPTNNYPPAQNGHMPEKTGYRPPNLQNGGSAYPPQSQYGSSYPQQPYYPPLQQQGPAPQGYPFPHGAPVGPYGEPGRRPSHRDDYDYDDKRSRSRSRSRSGRRRHHRHHEQPPPQQRKKSGVSTFLGAGGGALIGDAIFPGLGTIGGAILGGVGGHEYGKQRRSYSNPNSGRSRSYKGEREYYEDDYDSRGRRRY